MEARRAEEVGLFLIITKNLPLQFVVIIIIIIIIIVVVGGGRNRRRRQRGRRRNRRRRVRLLREERSASTSLLLRICGMLERTGEPNDTAAGGGEKSAHARY